MAATAKAQKAQAQGSNNVAIITMFFIFAMISFVTNMAAPFGNIWGFRYDWAGMAGNLMATRVTSSSRPAVLSTLWPVPSPPCS